MVRWEQVIKKGVGVVADSWVSTSHRSRAAAGSKGTARALEGSMGSSDVGNGISETVFGTTSSSLFHFNREKMLCSWKRFRKEQ